jgi:hypothetical protein
MECRTYQALTKETEDLISELLLPVQNQAEQHQRHDWAYGVYLLWNRLTLDSQNPEDTNRLLMLAETALEK